jgi:AraC-like DNA-binding protein
MHKAARLLQETSLPIGRISRQVGYRSEAAFSIAFKRNRGVQPREARSIQRAASSPINRDASVPPPASRQICAGSCARSDSDR